MSEALHAGTGRLFCAAPGQGALSAPVRCLQPHTAGWPSMASERAAPATRPGTSRVRACVSARLRSDFSPAARTFRQRLGLFASGSDLPVRRRHPQGEMPGNLPHIVWICVFRRCLGHCRIEGSVRVADELIRRKATCWAQVARTCHLPTIGLPGCVAGATGAQEAAAHRDNQTLNQEHPLPLCQSSMKSNYGNSPARY